MITTQITGERDIQFLLQGLDGFDRDRAVKSGLRAGAETFIRRGRSNLRARMKYRGGYTGNLLQSFRAKVKRRKPGALAGFSGKGHHAHLVDRGTSRRPHPLTGTSGIMPANYFWTNAYDSEQERAAEEVREGIARCVERINERRMQ